MTDVKVCIDIREYQPKDRYPTVSGAFEELESGEKMELINDHDIRPLLQYKLSTDYPNQYDWEYIEQGPQEWRAVIIKKYWIIIPYNYKNGLKNRFDAIFFACIVNIAFKEYLKFNNAWHNIKSVINYYLISFINIHLYSFFMHYYAIFIISYLAVQRLL